LVVTKGPTWTRGDIECHPSCHPCRAHLDSLMNGDIRTGFGRLALGSAARRVELGLTQRILALKAQPDPTTATRSLQQG
jgi:hypothetical protein